MGTTLRRMDRNEPEDGVAALRVGAYPQFPWIAREADFFESLYHWYSEHPLADHLYRWVSVTEEGEVVGHLAAFPLYYRINGERVIAHTPGDYMVLPDHSFQAFSLMRRFFGSVDNCVSCDMLPEVLGVETRLGAEVAGELRYAAKLLDVSRLPAPRIPVKLQKTLGLPEYLAPSGRSARSSLEGELQRESTLDKRPRAPIPAPLGRLLDRGGAALDDALGRRYGGGAKVEEVESFDESFDALFEKVARIVPCVVEKDAAFLRWRYGASSLQHPVTVLGARDRWQRLLGYAVLKLSEESPDGFIVDLTTVPGHGRTARALLYESARYFREQGAHIIRYRYSDSPASPGSEDLLRMGFFYRRGRGNSLLVRFSEPETHGFAREISNWTYNVGDGEATFWLK